MSKAHLYLLMLKEKYSYLPMSLLVLMSIFGCSSTENLELNENTTKEKSIEESLSSSKERKVKYLEQTENALLFKETDRKLSNNYYDDTFIMLDFPQRVTVDEVVEQLNQLVVYKGNYIDNCLQEEDSDDQPKITTTPNNTYVQDMGTISNGSKNNEGEENLKTFAYQGNMSGLFNTLETIYDVSINYHSNNYVVSKCRVANIPFHGLLSTMEASLETASTTSGVGNGSFSGQLDLSYTLKETIIEEVEMLLSEYGAVKLNDAVGSLLIVERPSNLREIERVINDYNSVLERQILLLVTVLRYGDQDIKQLGLDWDTVITSGSTSIIPSSQFTDTISGLDLGIKKDSSSTTDLILSSYFVNSHSLLTTKADLLTQNGVPTPLSVVKDQSYISSVSTEWDSEQEKEIRNVEVDVVSEGFNMMFKALALNDEISVTTHITQNELVSLKSDQDITLPTIFNRQFLQSFRVKSGDVILLAGYEESNARIDDSSAVPGTIALGGSNNHDLSKNKIVILIEPRIL